MRLIRLMGQDDIIIVCLGVLVMLLGTGMVRVGLYGKYLGRLKLVSDVQKYPEAPNRHQRRITVGLGVVSILTGVAMIVLDFVLIQKFQT